MSNLLTGVTLIKNGNRFKYPWKECISNMSKWCDEVIVNCGIDDDDDNTYKELIALAKDLGNVNVLPSTWDMSNTGNGKELATQINIILSFVRTEWIVYLQADEIIRWQEGILLRKDLSNLSLSVNQIELKRTYFWGSLEQRATEYEIWLGRIFRNSTAYVGGDGMYITQTWPGGIARLPLLIYHYSRMGSEEDVNTRWRNLDLFFHEAEEVAIFKKFKYDSEQRIDLQNYSGNHPDGIKEFYNEI